MGLLVVTLPEIVLPLPDEGQLVILALQFAVQAKVVLVSVPATVELNEIETGSPPQAVWGDSGAVTTLGISLTIRCLNAGSTPMQPFWSV